MKLYWFKAKKYGWGWVPATWQGWIILLIYLLLVIYFAFEISLIQYPTLLRIILFIGKIILLTIALIIVCYLKGEKLHWQWGDKK